MAAATSSFVATRNGVVVGYASVAVVARTCDRAFHINSRYRYPLQHPHSPPNRHQPSQSRMLRRYPSAFSNLGDLLTSDDDRTYLHALEPVDYNSITTTPFNLFDFL